jgi:hypothetical protein
MERCDGGNIEPSEQDLAIDQRRGPDHLQDTIRAVDIDDKAEIQVTVVNAEHDLAWATADDREYSNHVGMGRQVVGGGFRSDDADRRISDPHQRPNPSREMSDCQPGSILGG